MDFERAAWIVGILSCVGLSARLVGRVPLDERDRQFADVVASVQHEVRSQYVTEITDERLAQMQQGAMRGMLSVLDDYTVYVPPARKQEFVSQFSGNFVGIGVVIHANPAGEVEVRTPFEGGPAYEAGVESGDVFTAVNGESVAGLGVDELKQRLLGAEGTSVRVTLRRYDGSSSTIAIRRRAINTPTVTGYQRNADGTWDYFLSRDAGIAYVYISQFNEQTANDVRAALGAINDAGGARGLIVDLRFNGGGRVDVATEIADLFLDSGLIVRLKGRVRPESTAFAKPGDTLYHGPLAVIVNQDSASASEILAGALADHRRAVVVGTRTFGKGSVQEVEDWKEDGLLKITVAQYFLPSGRSVARLANSTVWGVDPNVEVKLSDAELEANYRSLTEPSIIPPKSHPTTRPARGNDRQLDAAVDALAAMLVREPATTRSQNP